MSTNFFNFFGREIFMILKSKGRKIASKLRMRIQSAFFAGDLKDVQNILKGNASIDPSNWLDSLISESLDSGQREDVDLLIGPDVKAAQPIDHTSALFIAALKGDMKICAELINKGANWLLSTKYRRPLLFRLLENDDKSVVAAICSQKNWYKKKSREGLTFAHVVSSLGKVDLLRHAIEAGADIHAISKSLRKTPLHVAFEEGRSDCVVYLVGAGSNVHAEDNSGRTPIHCGLASCKADAVVTYMKLNGLTPFDNVTESVCEYYKDKALEVVFSRSTSALRALGQQRQAHTSMNAVSEIENIFLKATAPIGMSLQPVLRSRAMRFSI
jgi:hypothetical protein